MTGRHAEGPGPEFWRDLAVFGLKVLFWGAVVIGAVWVFRQIPGAGSAPYASPGATTVVSTVPADTSTTSTTEPVRAPADVTVLVLNSTSQSGLAGRVTQTIAALGYRTLEAGNYATLLEDSVLRFAPGFEEEAADLARVFPAMAVEPNPEASNADLVLVLGSSFEE